MPKPDTDRVLDALRYKDGEACDVTLENGDVVRVFNIAWGFDMDNPVAHITTNISPSPPDTHTVDYFEADEVVKIVHVETMAVLFEQKAD